VQVPATEVDVLRPFVVGRGRPVARDGVYGAGVVDACGEEVWCSFLGGGGVDCEHFGGESEVEGSGVVVVVVEDVAVLRAPVSVAPVVDVVGGFDGISDEIGCSYLVLVVVLGRVRLERLFSESGFEGSRVDASGRDAAV
jgi:hypothetical protein